MFKEIFSFKKKEEAKMNENFSSEALKLGIEPNKPVEEMTPEEIQEFLDNHLEVDNYVILDDEERMLPNQQDHFVKINYYVGISIPDYEHAKEIFNKTLDKDYELKREK